MASPDAPTLRMVDAARRDTRFPDGIGQRPPLPTAAEFSVALLGALFDVQHGLRMKMKSMVRPWQLPSEAAIQAYLSNWLHSQHSPRSPPAKVGGLCRWSFPCGRFRRLGCGPLSSSAIRGSLTAVFAEKCRRERRGNMVTSIDRRWAPQRLKP